MRGFHRERKAGSRGKKTEGVAIANPLEFGIELQTSSVSRLLIKVPSSILELLCLIHVQLNYVECNMVVLMGCLTPI